jgi:hypothetical protein
VQFDFKELSKCPVDGFLWAIAERPKEALATIGCSVYEALFAAEHGNDVPQEDMVDPVSELAILRGGERHFGCVSLFHHHYHHDIDTAPCLKILLLEYGQPGSNLSLCISVFDPFNNGIFPHVFTGPHVPVFVVRAARAEAERSDHELGADDAHEVPKVKLHRKICVCARHVSIFFTKAFACMLTFV